MLALELTFKQMVADCELVCALGFLNKWTQIKACELALITQFSVFKFTLEFEQDHFFVFRALLHCNWNWSDKHNSVSRLNSVISVIIILVVVQINLFIYLIKNI